MKVRWYDRVLQFIGGFVLLTLGVSSLLFGSNVIHFDHFSMDTLFVESWQWTPIFVAVGVLLIALGIRLVVMTFGLSKSRYYAVQNNDSDCVQISIQAVDHLVRKCLQRFDAIFPTQVQIGGQHDAIVIRIRMAIRSDVRIPELVSEIRGAVKEYIEDCSGVKVERVEVMVDASKDMGQQPEKANADALKMLPPERVNDTQEILGSSHVHAREEGAFESHTPESTIEAARDPVYVSNTWQDEAPGTQFAQEPVAEPDMLSVASDATVIQDELVLLDALEPEIEDDETDKSHPAQEEEPDAIQ